MQGNVIDFPATFAKVMRNVYGWMSCGLLMTALTAMIVAGHPNIIYAIATNKLLLWGLFGAEIGLVLWLSARINSMSSIITKKDLSGIGKILTMLLIGLVIATIVNIFVASSGLSLILNYVGVFVFVGLTAYDTQKIKTLVHEATMYGDEEQTNKLALMGSLTLYLDFINLFLYLLRFLGNRK